MGCQNSKDTDNANPLHRKYESLHAIPWCFKDVVVDEYVRSVCDKLWQYVMSGESKPFQAAKKKQAGLTPLVFFYNTFYDSFFNLVPQSRSLFSRGMFSQSRMLSHIVRFVATSPDTEEDFDQTLRHLAVEHNMRGITFDQYSTLGLCFLFAVRKCAGDTMYDSNAKYAFTVKYSRVMAVFVPLVEKKQIEHDSSTELPQPKHTEPSSSKQHRESPRSPDHGANIRRHGSEHDLIGNRSGNNSPAPSRRTSKWGSNQDDEPSGARQRSVSFRKKQPMHLRGDGAASDGESTPTPPSHVRNINRNSLDAPLNRPKRGSSMTSSLAKASVSCDALLAYRDAHGVEVNTTSSGSNLNLNINLPDGSPSVECSPAQSRDGTPRENAVLAADGSILNLGAVTLTNVDGTPSPIPPARTATPPNALRTLPATNNNNGASSTPPRNSPNLVTRQLSSTSSGSGHSQSPLLVDTNMKSPNGAAHDPLSPHSDVVTAPGHRGHHNNNSLGSHSDLGASSLRSAPAIVISARSESSKDTGMSITNDSDSYEPLGLFLTSFAAPPTAGLARIPEEHHHNNNNAHRHSKHRHRRAGLADDAPHSSSHSHHHHHHSSSQPQTPTIDRHHDPASSTTHSDKHDEMGGPLSRSTSSDSLGSENSNKTAQSH